MSAFDLPLEDRLLRANVEAFEIAGVYLGLRLRLYQALAEGQASSRAIARRTGLAERYVREWLEQQAVSGYIAVASKDATADVDREYCLTADQREVLLNTNSARYMSPLALTSVGVLSALDSVEHAFRTGCGVPNEAYGHNFRIGVAEGNRAVLVNDLAKWLSAMPDVDRRLREPYARVADIGCGLGWASIVLAQCCTDCEVVGYDLDQVAISEARINAARAGVDDRVVFLCEDASSVIDSAGCDLVISVEVIHDLGRPIECLQVMRRLAAPREGAVLIVDQRAAESFSVPGDILDRYLYGYSLLNCLPVGMNDQPSAGTGAVMRPSTFLEYAQSAGFNSVEELPVTNYFWRLYRLHC